MWPSFSCMSKEESVKNLRQLELEAYATLISALRAQGPLTQEKRRILRETCRLLNITVDRHKTEVRRAVNDEKLTTIAYHIHGPGISSEDWCQEGRRVLPMLQRISPQTLHPIITDTFPSCSGIQQNYQEVGHSTFERKKISNEGSELLFKKSEKKNYSDTFANSTDPVEEPEDEPTSLNADYQLKHRPLITKPSFYRQSFESPTQDQDKVAKIYSNKKLINKNQKLMIVSNTQTIPSNSILHKTLSLPISKVTKLNLDKFKIVSSSSLPSIHVSNLVSTENTGTSKHKLVTSKSGKKVIPLSQLQMLNHKLGSKGGIKVLPLSSKLFGKNITMTRITSGPMLNTTASFPLLSTKNEEKTSVKSESNMENKAETENAVYKKDESPSENSEVTKNTESKKEIISKIKTEDKSGNFRIEELGSKELESEIFGTQNDVYKSEECKNEKVINQKTEKINIKIEGNDYKVKEIENKDIATYSQTDENFNDNEKKNNGNDDDLAALMEIDSSEFIEPELKDSVIVKKEF